MERPSQTRFFFTDRRFLSSMSLKAVGVLTAGYVPNLMRRIAVWNGGCALFSRLNLHDGMNFPGGRGQGRAKWQPQGSGKSKLT